MGRSRYKFTHVDVPHFMTCTVLHWIPVFTQPETVAILLDSLRFLTRDGMKLYAYVILENHMHLIAQSDRIDRDIARFKSFTAKELIRYLHSHAGAWERGREGAWERGFWNNWLFIKKHIKMTVCINSGRKVFILNIFKMKT